MRRSPRGERGLKPFQFVRHDRAGGSLPARGAWIETRKDLIMGSVDVVAPRAGSVD